MEGTIWASQNSLNYNLDPSGLNDATKNGKSMRKEFILGCLSEREKEDKE